MIRDNGPNYMGPKVFSISERRNRKNQEIISSREFVRNQQTPKALSSLNYGLQAVSKLKLWWSHPFP
jgi:hypothetical protein